MKMLDLNDLKFTSYDYKSKALGLRDWFTECLDLHPVYISEVSKKTGIGYRPLLNFSTRKTSYMSFKNMCALRSYIESFMNENILNDGTLDEEDFFVS